MTRPRVLVVGGPNLNLVGLREPARYGSQSMAAILADLADEAAGLGAELDCFQSNGEGALIDRIQAARTDGTAGLLVNLGGYTHTSVALRDALLAVDLPFVEVHLSNIWAREPFRHHSLISDVAVGVVAGLGPVGYSLALRGLVHHLQLRNAAPSPMGELEPS